ncbi:MAG: [FeFe] hydrogenase H-cluster radical SAM maturase HydE [Lachnospiraceae bacterium]|nr:[FeFe] hydrogenase H-cluster radical SAM maturase HydE [Lachnospiraceae bacterium]
MEKKLIHKLQAEHKLSNYEYEQLLSSFPDEEIISLALMLANKERERLFKNTVYIRGLIEISSICRNNCFYCGIRRDNHKAERYRLNDEEIISCCIKGYELGFRTFVLQGGEDPALSDEFLIPIIKKIKDELPECALTLSLGERSYESYKSLYLAGADRYLLRHETADEEHYNMLHPIQMSFENRIKCLYDLRDIGYQVGCGFMVGTPGQTKKTLSEDLKFIEEFRPEMCGIGPFIPHHDTPFADIPPGNAKLTCFLLSLLRLIHPAMMIPSTTALATLIPDGRIKGISSGANVIMPNLTLDRVRGKYELYNNKAYSGRESAEEVDLFAKELIKYGYRIIIARGDYGDQIK